MLQALEVAGYRFSEVVRVRWTDIDPQKIVYNAHYLAYIDDAFGEYCQALFSTYFPAGMEEIVVAKAIQQFRASARGADRLQVGVKCTRIGRSSLTFAFEIRREVDELLVMNAELTYVNIDLPTGKSKPIPEHTRQVLRKFDSPAEG